MKHPITRRAAALFATWCATGLLVAGCNTQPSDAKKADTRPPEELIKERAGERWQALMALEYEKAYSYLAPSVRSVMSLDGFRRHMNLGLNVVEAPWKKAEVRGVQCPTAEACDATVYIESVLNNVPHFTGMTTSAQAQERWVLQDGQWWLYLR